MREIFDSIGGGALAAELCMLAVAIDKDQIILCDGEYRIIIARSESELYTVSTDFETVRDVPKSDLLKVIRDIA